VRFTFYRVACRPAIREKGLDFAGREDIFAFRSLQITNRFIHGDSFIDTQALTQIAVESNC
jgi:hypothetical protein